jgi:hypothetical protein
MTLAILAGLAAYIGINGLLGAVHGFLCGSSQAMSALLRFSPLAFPIRLACWALAGWAGWSAFAAVS